MGSYPAKFIPPARSSTIVLNIEDDRSGTVTLVDEFIRELLAISRRRDALRSIFHERRARSRFQLFLLDENNCSLKIFICNLRRTSTLLSNSEIAGEIDPEADPPISTGILEFLRCDSEMSVEEVNRIMEDDKNVSLMDFAQFMLPQFLNSEYFIAWRRDCEIFCDNIIARNREIKLAVPILVTREEKFVITAEASYSCDDCPIVENCFLHRGDNTDDEKDHKCLKYSEPTDGDTDVKLSKAGKEVLQVANLSLSRLTAPDPANAAIRSMDAYDGEFIASHSRWLLQLITASECLPFPVCVCNAKRFEKNIFPISYCNPQFESLLRSPRDMIVGGDAVRTIVAYPDMVDSLAPDLSEDDRYLLFLCLMKSKRSTDFEINVWSKAGNCQNCQVFLHPVFDKWWSLSHIILVFSSPMTTNPLSSKSLRRAVFKLPSQLN